MKTFIPIAIRNHKLLMVILMGAVASQPVLAQDAAKESILQNSANEQDVRQHTAVLVQQVQSLIDELTANGISGDDIKVLQTTKAVLNNLSSNEMARVIASLQKAGASAGTETGRQSAVDAYAGQTGIILEFHQILKDYEQRQAALELPERFKELTDRQTETMWTTVQVATESAGKSTAEMTSTQQTTAQIVQSDQDALASDVARAQQQLEAAVQGSTGDEGNAMQQAEKDLKTGVLQKALDEASTDLKAGHLLQATSEQKIARDQLRLVTKDLNPSTDAVAALNETSAALAKLIQEQQDLLDATNAGLSVRPRPTGLDLKQGLLVDKTNSLQDDMQSLSPSAAADVKDAINPMQLSRAALAPRGAFANSVPNQQAAIAKLEDAQKQVQQQLADAQKAAADAAKDSVAKMDDLKKQIQLALQAQQAITNQTNQSAGTALPQQPQGQLQQETAALEQTAQPVCFPASQALGDAASQMTKAQQAMSTPALPTIQTAQQAAQAALAQALQDVSQQIANAQAAAADPAALAAAAQSLDKAQSDVSQAIAASTPAPSTPASSTPPSSPDSTNSASATPPTPSSPMAANTPSASAPSSLPSDSSTNAPSASPPTASSPTASSPTASSPTASSPTASSPSASSPSSSPTASAQPSSSPQGSSTPAASPPPAAGAPSMAAAAAALAQASAATAAAAATPGLPAAATAAVASAQASIGQGQQAAAAGNAPATAAAAAAAQASLAQAQAAVAVAQAGMSASPMAGSGPPGPPGPPGAGPPGPPGPGLPGMTPTPPAPDMASAEGAKIVSGGSSDKGTLHDVKGLGSFLTVASRDRTAIGQTQTEKRPQEYAPMIDQYMKNLADQASSSSP